MNPAHLHLLINHAPLFALLIGLAILVTALARHNEELRRAGLVLLVLGGVGAVPAFLSGEPAEDAIEDLPGVSEKLIERHEEAADFALWGAGLAGLAALGALLLQGRRPVAARRLTGASVGLSLIALGVMARTANLGGQIRHPEIRGEATGSGATEAVGPPGGSRATP